MQLHGSYRSSKKSAGRKNNDWHARHYYDMYMFGNSVIKEEAFHRVDLLIRDINFKQKFYYTKKASYDTAVPGSLSDVNQGMIESLTYLQTGHALVFGTAINLPTLTRFPEANPKPDSDNARISEKWYIE